MKLESRIVCASGWYHGNGQKYVCERWRLCITKPFSIIHLMRVILYSIICHLKNSNGCNRKQKHFVWALYGNLHANGKLTCTAYQYVYVHSPLGAGWSFFLLQNFFLKIIFLQNWREEISIKFQASNVNYHKL